MRRNWKESTAEEAETAFGVADIDLLRGTQLFLVFRKLLKRIHAPRVAEVGVIFETVPKETLRLC